MRIAHFSDSHPGRPDGVSASVGRTVALLRSAGHLVRDHRPGRLLGRLRPDELRSVPYPVRRMRVAVPWGAGPSVPADVVHIHTTGTAGMTGFAYAARHRLPVVVTWHIDMLAYVRHYPDLAFAAASSAHRMRLGWSARDYLELTDWNGRRHHRLAVLGHGLFARTHLILAPSRKAAASLAAVGHTPSIRVLPTPVALRAATIAPRSGGPVVLCVGRVTPEKNPALLLAAFQLVLRSFPDAQLVFVGAHQGRPTVRRAADRLGLGDRVSLIPPVPPSSVDDFYARADVFAFPSLTDTQGLVLAEAEAAGVPVVVADAALAHRIDPALPPRVTASPDPESFAAAIVSLLSDTPLRAAVVSAGHRDIAAHTPARYLSLLTQAYRDVSSR
ncbi:glycosyltransferase [Actinoplanes sp. NPDC051470]|uniref:glycosyltransferase n=1 Tax=Actinoplanes sp. NPDC051470 TaxID=3157224 RepID=UPI003434EEBB